MGKTFKDRRVKTIEEKGYTPKVLKEEYRREKINKRTLEDDTDDEAEE